MDGSLFLGRKLDGVFLFLGGEVVLLLGGKFIGLEGKILGEGQATMWIQMISYCLIAPSTHALCMQGQI